MSPFLPFFRIPQRVSMNANEMYNLTIESIHIDQFAKQSLDIAMEHMQRAAECHMFQVELTLVMPPKTILMLRNMKYGVTFTETGKTLISWNKHPTKKSSGLNLSEK